MTQEDILNNPEKYDLSIETVGTGTLKSPMKGVPFVSESERVSLTADVGRIQDFCKRGIEIPSLEAAGPRETIFHDPAWTRAGIVTCGGLCPGLNNVIKGLVQVLWFDYGVRNIFGIPYGYRGLNPAYGYSPIILNPDVVDAIQEDGGTILGSSRGNQDAKVMVDTLMRLNINVLFCIGGDGTFNEVASGLLLAGSNTPIAYIPAGSTNDFASSLGLSKNLLQAAQDVVDGKPCSLDIGKFNDRYFSYIASFGAFTRASYATPQNMKNALGHFAYILAGIKEVAAIRSTHLRFTLEDGSVYEDDYIFGAISNSTSVAGILTLAPGLVDMSDGLFELLLIRKPNTAIELSDCVLALTTQDYNTPMLTLASSSRIEIDAPETMDWTLDGEHADGAAHCVVENLHHGIQVIVNSK